MPKLCSNITSAFWVAVRFIMIFSLHNPLATVYQQRSTHHIRIILVVCAVLFLDIFGDMKDHKVQRCMVIADGVTDN